MSRDTPKYSRKKKTFQHELEKNTDMDESDTHQLAGATQTTYNQLQCYVRLFDSDDSPVVVPHLDLVRKIAPAQALFIMSDRHARAANKELATRLAKLPRELRDMVYTHLWTQQSHSCLDEDGVLERDSRQQFLTGCKRLLFRPLHHRCSSPPCSCLRSLPHFVDRNYIGVQIAREALEQFKYVVHTDGYWKRTLTIQVPKTEAVVHTDIFHAGITMENVLPNVQIDFHLSNWIDCASGEGEEIGKEAVPWWKDARSLNSAANALRALSSQDFTCIECESKDTPPRELRLFFDSEGVWEDQVSYMKTLGPAFRGLHEKGFSTCFQYMDEILHMYFILEADAWN
jgi:hypothetical protein